MKLKRKPVDIQNLFDQKWEIDCARKKLLILTESMALSASNFTISSRHSI